MSATDELLRMLDERGIEYESISDTCTYVSETQLTEYEPGIIGLQMRNLTPEQAIADELNATMGGGECVFEINTDATAIKCSSCGYSLPKGTDLDDTRFCGGCGQAVKR